MNGIGIHTGTMTQVRLLPAAPGTGVVFRRVDIGVDIPASVENVADTSNATVLKVGGAMVTTGEHFLASLYGMGVDNAIIEVDGPELPVLDGSALPIAEAIALRGTTEQPEQRRYLEVCSETTVRNGQSYYTLVPSEVFTIVAKIEFPGTVLDGQIFRATVCPEIFLREIAGARTLVFSQQVTELWETGFLQGISTDNCIILDGDRVKNPGGLRFPDEFVRHKVLDLIGDISLVRHPLRCFLTAVRPGHTSNRHLAEFLSGLTPAIGRENI
jgi:UDP-3-O-[3-hydroxymyristoyl] N-acetylglucosamine deacetylase